MRFISSVGMSMALLLAGLLALYSVVLVAKASEAQEGTTMMVPMTMEDTTDFIAPGPDEECPGAEVVNTTTGTGDKESPVFAIEGDSLRLTVAVAATSQNSDDAFVGISVRTEDDEGVGSFSKDGEGTESSIVNEGPGNFFLDILSANAEYTIVVEDCDGSDQGGNTNGDEDTDDDGVIDDTIPKKPLPDTGGSTALMIGGSALLLLYGSLVAWRLKTRER